MSKNSRGHVSFNRSLFLTLGMLLVALPIVIWVKQGNRSGTWPLFAWILFFALPIFGVLSFIFGIAASDNKINSSISVTPSTAGLVMSALAMPVYLILNAFRRKK